MDTKENELIKSAIQATEASVKTCEINNQAKIIVENNIEKENFMQKEK